MRINNHLELRLWLAQQKNHRGRSNMKVIKAPEQATFNYICHETEELKERLHRIRESQKDVERWTTIAFVAIGSVQAILCVSVILYLV